MQIRILRVPNRPIEGVAATRFEAGATYEVGVALAAILLSEGWAEPASRGVVLVIDDDPELRSAFATFLRSDGYTVILAQHGQEGLACLAAWRPDLIVLDLDMPVMDGWQFRAAQTRLADKALATTPVLLVSATAGVERHAEALHASAFIEKPFDVDRLLTAVGTVVHRA